MSEKEVWSSTWYFTFDLRTSGTTTSASLAATEILDSDLRKKLFPTAQTVSFSIDSTVSISGNNVVGSSVPSCEFDNQGDYGDNSRDVQQFQPDIAIRGFITGRSMRCSAVDKCLKHADVKNLELTRIHDRFGAQAPRGHHQSKRRPTT